MGLTWVMGEESSVVVVEPPLHSVFFPTRCTGVGIPPMASCKLKHSLYHLIHSSTTCMQMVYPIRSSVIYPIMLPLMTTNLLFQTDRGKNTPMKFVTFHFSPRHLQKGCTLQFTTISASKPTATLNCYWQVHILPNLQER